jgi:hypothetical protein
LTATMEMIENGLPVFQQAIEESQNALIAVSAA